MLVQDYHLALLGPRLAAQRSDLTTVHFSHTPFAPPHLMRVLPTESATELLEGMSGHATCGFHSPRWAADYQASCREVLGRIRRERRHERRHVAAQPAKLMKARQHQQINGRQQHRIEPMRVGLEEAAEA